MAQVPDIKPEVNQESEREKKGAGLMARLFGAGGSGGMGGLGGAAAGGGLLATKAGLMALIVVGTTVAGGIGWVGYRQFGPGQETVSNSDNLQLFAPKPKESSDAQPAPKDGTSASLTNLAAGNAASKAADMPPSGASSDAGASGAGAAASGGSAASKGSASMGAASSGNGVNKSMLKNTGKFGALSSTPGGSGASVANVKPGAGADATAAGSRGNSGRIGAMKTNGGGAVAGGTARAMTGRNSSKAFGQAFGVLKDAGGAQSSYAAGRTYEGSAANNGGVIGADGSAIGVDGGPGSGASMAGAKDLPNKANDKMELPQSIPTPPAAPVVPWQKAMDQAKMMLMAAIALFVLASYLMKSKDPVSHGIKVAMGLAIMALGAAVIALGAQIATGVYGQKTQGAILTAAGIGVVILGVAVMKGTQDTEAKAGTPGTTNSINSKTVQMEDGSTTQVNVAGNTDSAGNFTKGASGGTDPVASSAGNMGSGLLSNPLVLIGGGMAALGLAGTMLTKPKNVPAATFQNGNAPQGGLMGYQALPSETALKKMIA